MNRSGNALAMCLSTLLSRTNGYMKSKLVECNAFLECCGCSKSPAEQKEYIRCNLMHEMLTQKDRNNQLMNELKRSQLIRPEDGATGPFKWPRRPKLFSKNWCWKCFSFLFAVSLSTMNRRKQEIIVDNKVEWKRKEGSGKNRAPAKWTAVIDFLEQLEEMQGETWPDKIYVELPPNSKFNIWNTYNVECELAHKREFCCEYSYFCDIWRKDFWYMRIPRNPRWVKCLCLCTAHFCFRSNAQFVLTVRQF